MGMAGVEAEEGLTLDMWGVEDFKTAVANRDWRPREYMSVMRERFGVTIEQGAQDILMRMPTTNKSPRAEIIATHRVWGPANDSFGPVLASAQVRWGCGEIPDVMLPAACTQVLRQWKDRVTYTHVVLAHKPQWVDSYPSWLCFRIGKKDEVILGHACVKGLWHLPGTLFVFAMPPRRR